MMCATALWAQAYTPRTGTSAATLRAQRTPCACWRPTWSKAHMRERAMKAGLPGRQAPASPEQGPVTLRALTPEDAPLYCRWLKNAFVAENYGGADVDFTEEMARGFLPPGRVNRLFSSLPGPAASPWGSASWQGWTRRCAAPPGHIHRGRRRPAGAGWRRRAGCPLEYGFGTLGLHSVWLKRLGGQRPGPGAVPPRRLPGGRPPPGRLALARKAVRPCVYGPSGRGIFSPCRKRAGPGRAGGAPPG